jgi:hypothetical protein
MIHIPALTAFYSQPKVDDALNFDSVARAALETYRDSWQPMPTCNLKEFGAFFSGKNMRHIMSETVRLCKPYRPEEDDVFAAMVQAFQMILPRSDQTDERRENFSDAATRSYVDDMNSFCLDKLYADTIAAGNQSDHYYKYMQGPTDMIDDVYNVDSTTKHNCAMTDFSWRMPW